MQSLGPRAKLLINAMNVHTGGGATLLHALLMANFTEAKRVCFVDARLRIPKDLPPDVQITKVTPTISARLRAEICLARMATEDDRLLCFGNMPPLFSLPCFVVVFIQNRYLVDRQPLRGFTLKGMLRLSVERWWLRAFARHANEFVVQTPTMQRLVLRRLSKAAQIRLLPFVDHIQGWPNQRLSAPAKPASEYRFLYVASPEPHKNHRVLIEAWRLLAAEELFPQLRLTLENDGKSPLSEWVKRVSDEDGLCIQLGCVDQEHIADLYSQSEALVFPSLMESLGLPLIEARQAGLDILAGECDYVRDVMDPCQSFDPGSAISIARAVKRYMSVYGQAVPLLGANGFLRQIWNRPG